MESWRRESCRGGCPAVGAGGATSGDLGRPRGSLPGAQAVTVSLCLSAPPLAGAAVAGIYRVAGKNMAPLEALVWGVGQTVLTLIISFSRILATL